MKRFCKVLLATILGAAFYAGSASAAVVTSLVGDKDCFGLGGPCPDGTLWRDGLGGVFFNNYQDPGDPAFTDKWSSDIGPTYQHSYSLGGQTPLSAELEIRTAGLADNRGPWDVFFEGVLVGVFPTNTSTNAFQEVVTHVFSIPVALLTGADDVLLAINIPVQTDGYSIDFSELRVTVTEAPEPSTVGLFALAMLVAVAMRRRRTRE